MTLMKSSFVKNDLRLCGEFYIDEVVLERFGSERKIETGFYSSNLFSYLLFNLFQKRLNTR